MKTSLDKFLKGKLNIYQPIKGYRVGIDAVILASCVRAFKNCKILDVGSGTGIISFCIAYRSKNTTILGIEKNFQYHLLAIKSLKINKLQSKIIFLNKDFGDIDKMQSDIIVSNPPWFKKNSTYESGNSLINVAKIESLKLDLWIERVFRNLKSKGEYYTIFPYNRIQELAKILQIYFNIIKIYPISSFKDCNPDKAIVYAKRSGKGHCCYEEKRIIIHKRNKSFMNNINSILREGNTLSLA